MTRLIEAETVKEYLKRVIWGADAKIDRWVDDMPTIDAIPVEWIQTQRTENPQTVVEFARNVAYRTVLYGWRAEQEDE